MLPIRWSCQRPNWINTLWYGSDALRHQGSYALDRSEATIGFRILVTKYSDQSFPPKKVCIWVVKLVSCLLFAVWGSLRIVNFFNVRVRPQRGIFWKIETQKQKFQRKRSIKVRIRLINQLCETFLYCLHFVIKWALVETREGWAYSNKPLIRQRDNEQKKWHLEKKTFKRVVWLWLVTRGPVCLFLSLAFWT